MKICLINNLYKPYYRGGADRIVELIVRGLKENGHDVFIITTKPIFTKLNQPAGVQNSKLKIYYIRALYFSLNKMPLFLRFFWHIADMFDIWSYLRVKAILRKEKPEVVISNNLKGIGYLIPRAIKNLRQKLNIKHIHILHDIQLFYPSGLMVCGREGIINGLGAKIYADLCCRLFSSPSAVISPSTWLMKEHLERNFFKTSKKIILANPVLISPEIKNFKDGAGGGEARRKNKIFRFLFLGLVEEHKGIIFLINFFNKLCGSFESGKCELIVAGSGSKLKQARRLAGDNRRIKFLGKIDRSEVEMLMLKADCLIMPSLCYENSPTVIYEAAMAGLQVIASRLGGTTELVHKLGGILFKPGNGGDLMYQMKWAMDNRAKLEEIGQTSRRRVRQFSLNNYITKLEELIK